MGGVDVTKARREGTARAGMARADGGEGGPDGEDEDEEVDVDEEVDEDTLQRTTKRRRI